MFRMKYLIIEGETLITKKKLILYIPLQKIKICTWHIFLDENNHYGFIVKHLFLWVGEGRIDAGT